MSYYYVGEIDKGSSKFISNFKFIPSKEMISQVNYNYPWSKFGSFSLFYAGIMNIDIIDLLIWLKLV